VEIYEKRAEKYIGEHRLRAGEGESKNMDVSRDIPDDRCDIGRWSVMDGSRSYHNVAKWQQQQSDHFEYDKKEGRGIDDGTRTEAFRRIRRIREEREAALRRVQEELAAHQKRVRAELEASNRELRAEIERDSRKAREDRVGRAFGSRIEKAREGNSRQTIHKFVQHYRKGIEQLAEAVQGAISSTRYAIRSLGRTLANVKNAIKPNKKEKQIDEVEKAIEQHFREGNPNTPRRGGMRM